MKIIHTFNHLGVHDYKETYGTTDPPIFTVFLRDSALVVEEKIKAEGINGGYYYKRASSLIYNVQTNKHGEKYLRVLKKTGKGIVLSVDANEMGRSDLYTWATGQNKHCDEMVTLIEEHLTKILGFKFAYGPVPQVDDPETGHYSPDYLCYPFYRSSGNKEFAQRLLAENRKSEPDSFGMRHAFKIHLTGSRGLYAALRNSKTQEEFVKNLVYKSYVKTEADFQMIVESPKLISTLSKIDMRVSVTEAVSRGLVDIFQSHNDYMTNSEFYSFKFLLSYLPKKRVSEVLDLASNLAAFRTSKDARIQLRTNINDMNRYGFRNACVGQANQIVTLLRKVPAKERQIFAVAFWEEFQKSYRESENNYVPHSYMSKKERQEVGFKAAEMNFIQTVDAHMKAYARTHLTKIEKNSKERCIATAQELFGQDITQKAGFTFETKYVEKLGLQLEYVSFKSQQSGMFQKRFSNLISMISTTPETKDQIENALIFNPIQHILTNHTDIKTACRAMMISELEQIFRKTATVLDVELSKVGQAPTPENRIICLKSTARDRKFKVNWRYYSMGVSPEEVPTYKTAGIRSKRDVLFWVDTKKSVPKEMYDELLHDLAYGSPLFKSDSLSGAF